MRFRLRIIFIAAFSFAYRANANEIHIDSWSLGSRISANGLETATNGTGMVQNPLHGAYPTSLGLSTANSIFDVSWDSDGFFNFLVTGEHTAAGHNDLFSRSTGSIFFTPQVDSIFIFDLEYNYALGNGIRDAFVSTTLGQIGQPAIHHHAERRLTLLGQFNGQIEYEAGDILLSAGEPYAFNYQLQLDSFSGSPTVLSTGNGFVDIRITPIPEPASLMLLVFGSLLALRRRQSRILDRSPCLAPANLAR